MFANLQTNQEGTIMYTQLMPEFDSAKSFYGNAGVVTHDNGIRELYSYGQLVAKVYPVTGAVKVFPAGVSTATTLRHVKEFLMQLGYYTGTKQDIIDNYVIEHED